MITELPELSGLAVGGPRSTSVGDGAIAGLPRSTSVGDGAVGSTSVGDGAVGSTSVGDGAVGDGLPRSTSVAGAVAGFTVGCSIGAALTRAGAFCGIATSVGGGGGDGGLPRSTSVGGGGGDGAGAFCGVDKNATSAAICTRVRSTQLSLVSWKQSGQSSGNMWGRLGCGAGTLLNAPVLCPSKYS